MQNKIALVGEAWGEYEERERAPFVGPTGHELTKMLTEAGVHRADCFLTNVFNLRPPANKIEALCGGKAQGLPGYPALVKGKFVRREFAPELERLAKQLDDVNPNVTVALGNTAMWALCGKTTITKLRGSTTTSTHTISGFKVLPTYHPAAILRQWDLRPVAVIDLMKALRESEWPEIRRPKRIIYIPETIEDLNVYYETNIRRCSRLAVDIETAGNQITCIGFAPCTTSSLVIPFVNRGRANRSYWEKPSDEYLAWAFVKGICGDPRLKKVFQNGLYDIAFLWRSMKIKVYGACEDTMLLHHALQPESLKSLGFLGSIYCDEGSWKQMRERHTTIKRDD